MGRGHCQFFISELWLSNKNKTDEWFLWPSLWVMLNFSMEPKALFSLLVPKIPVLPVVGVHCVVFQRPPAPGMLSLWKCQQSQRLVLKGNSFPLCYSFMLFWGSLEALAVEVSHSQAGMRVPWTLIAGAKWTEAKACGLWRCLYLRSSLLLNTVSIPPTASPTLQRHSGAYGFCRLG